MGGFGNGAPVMRLAIAIIGLVLVGGFLFQGVFENVLSSDDASMWRGGVSSIFVAAPWLFAAMYVFWLPRLAAVLFITAGVSAWLAAATTSQTNLWAWGGVAFVLAAGSIVAARQQRSKDAQAHDPGAPAPAMASGQVATSVVASASMPISEPQAVVPVALTYPCPVCGTVMDMEQQFCQECGTPAPAHATSRTSMSV
jgi:ABC-type Fe3+-siderophore transport system permease subunit